MGEIEGWAEASGPLLNGLLPGSGPIMGPLDTERWSKAEERTADLIECIQPNQLSEERRNAVADYVQRLIMKCFPCQVCTFGSVPLKTYLPDGDIDLTSFNHDPNLKDTWASEVRDLLQNEEKNENAEFHVKEVQYIQAEVKIIKCLVENIVVDISFNQVGGLCTLCFLDEVDNLINQNHLFKRSIILIKAWCYYESRILGAHHGLISTYALETLVLYIFHVFNNSFHGPLEVLYRFLEFFSIFDWDNFCVSLWGPVPISALPHVTVESPRKDTGELLLSKLFLDACSSVYAVFPGGQENNGQPFVSKHLNVIDPLRVNNNLGRSVSKGNFFRIRSAFAFGAKRLARLLECPKDKLAFEVNQFFMNTWARHGSGHRPDAPGIDSRNLRLSTPNNAINEPENSNNNTIEGRFLFARTHSSPELTANARPSLNENNRRKNLGSESVASHSSHSSVEDTSSVQHVLAHKNHDFVIDSSSEDFSSSTAAQLVHPEGQDIVKLMSSASLQGFNGHQVHVPFNLPFQIPQSILASMGYGQRNFPGFGGPTNIPFTDPSFANAQFPQLTHYFPGMESNENVGSEKMNEADTGGFQPRNEIFAQADDKKPSEPLPGSKYVPPFRARSKTFSESSFAKEKRGRKIDDDQEQSSLSSPETKMVEMNQSSIEHVAPLQIPRHHFEASHTSGSDSMMPFGPVVLNPSPRQRMNDNSGLVAFYPTGPPIPFITMLPRYNVPHEGGTTSVTSSTHFEGDESFNSRLEQFDEERKADILNSDFASHWQNLQLGRFCQNPRPFVHPSPVMVPQAYLQGQFPYDYGHHLVPVTPRQSVTSRPPPHMNQPYIDETTRSRNGTGTYLPSPKASARDRHSSGPRKGSYYHHDNRNEDYNNGNINSKSRGAGNNRSNQNYKPNSRPVRLGPNENRADRAGSSNQHSSSLSYQSQQNGPLDSSQNNSQNMAYNVYPNGVYPFEHSVSQGEQLEFGSLGPVGGSMQRPSPDQPSSPHHQRRI